MGDLADDTRVEQQSESHFTACPRAAWEIWGPMGGYMVALALRAAGLAATFHRPASLACQYLGVASFDPVEIEVTTTRRSKRAQSLRVTITQTERPILDTQLWCIDDDGEGLTHHEIAAPTVPDPDELTPWDEILEDGPPFPFWDNVESRPVALQPTWPPPGPIPPVWQTWCRLRPTPTFADPWLDAARTAILLDVQSWPPAHAHHAWADPPFIAPSLDLYVAFHEPAPADPWLLADGFSPVAGDGLVGWTGRLWSSTRRLVASGAGQQLCRRIAT
ncbi:MAG TPA: thioesterase family protein [Acidimicrobiia bacterium]|nr:thioesterase family protein [Acidimicrobiia bacterium]